MKIGDEERKQLQQDVIPKYTSSDEELENPKTQLKMFVTRPLPFESSKLEKQPPEMFYKKGALTDFAQFAGKRLYQSLFLIKLQASGLRSATLLKKRL